MNMCQYFGKWAKIFLVHPLIAFVYKVNIPQMTTDYPVGNLSHIFPK